MSTSAINAAHLVVIPIRYAVGKWYNIPTDTLLAFNAADIGLNLVGRITYAFYKAFDNKTKNGWKLPFYQDVTLGIALRTCAMLSALYITSKFTNPMPLECAMVTVLASTTSMCALAALAEWRQGKNK